MELKAANERNMRLEAENEKLLWRMKDVDKLMSDMENQFKLETEGLKEKLWKQKEDSEKQIQSL